MSLDLYTNNISLTQKAKFWGDFVSSLKGILGHFRWWLQPLFHLGNADLYAAPEPRITHWYPSITETLPPTYSGLRQEFGKLESLMWNQRAGSRAPTPVLPDANNRWERFFMKTIPPATIFLGFTVWDMTTAPSIQRYTALTEIWPRGEGSEQYVNTFSHRFNC